MGQRVLKCDIQAIFSRKLDCDNSLVRGVAQGFHAGVSKTQAGRCFLLTASPTGLVLSAVEQNREQKKKRDEDEAAKTHPAGNFTVNQRDQCHHSHKQALSLPQRDETKSPGGSCQTLHFFILRQH